jgi:hypothetical protein
VGAGALPLSGARATAMPGADASRGDRGRSHIRPVCQARRETPPRATPPRADGRRAPPLHPHSRDLDLRRGAGATYVRVVLDVLG